MREADEKKPQMYSTPSSLFLWRGGAARPLAILCKNEGNVAKTQSKLNRRRNDPADDHHGQEHFKVGDG